MSMMKTKARSAIKDYTQPWKKDEEETQDFDMTKNKAANSEEEPEGTDEPADVSGLAAKKDDEKKKDSNWAGKVVAAIAGVGGAVAGANLQHKRNQQREKLYQAKRKSGNYLS